MTKSPTRRRPRKPRKKKPELEIKREGWQRYMADDGYFTHLVPQLASMKLSINLHAEGPGSFARVQAVGEDQLRRQLEALRDELNGLDLWAETASVKKGRK